MDRPEHNSKDRELGYLREYRAKNVEDIITPINRTRAQPFVDPYIDDETEDVTKLLVSASVLPNEREIIQQDSHSRKDIDSSSPCGFPLIACPSGSCTQKNAGQKHDAS
jgi:hypothetical protein